MFIPYEIVRVLYISAYVHDNYATLIFNSSLNLNTFYFWYIIVFFTGSNKFDVYLIHSAEEKSYANTLKERLESYDLSVVTEEDTEPGKYHVQGVSSFVQSCSKCLVVLSESSHDSAWCTLELLLALEKSHRLNTMSVVVLRVLGSTKWQFQLVRHIAIFKEIVSF